MADENKPDASPVNAPQPTPPTAELPLTEVTADELAKPLAENMPEPTKSAAIPATENPQPTAQPISAPKIESGLKDNAGNQWDPSRYKSVEGNPGTPRYDKRGNFIPINKGRPAGSTNAAPSNPTEIKSVMPSNSSTEKSAETVTPTTAKSPTIAGDGEKVPDKYDHAAELYFNMFVPVTCGLVTEEFLPGYSYDEKGNPFIDSKIRDMEKQSITIPLAAYLRETQTTELSPKWALTLASVGYIGRRAQMPQTQAKAKTWFSWFGGKKK